MPDRLAAISAEAVVQVRRAAAGVAFGIEFAIVFGVGLLGLGGGLLGDGVEYLDPARAPCCGLLTIQLQLPRCRLGGVL